jgi:hypothetical protein
LHSELEVHFAPLPFLSPLAGKQTPPEHRPDAQLAFPVHFMPLARFEPPASAVALASNNSRTALETLLTMATGMV